MDSLDGAALIRTAAFTGAVLLLRAIIPSPVRAEPAFKSVAVLYFEYEGKDAELAAVQKGLAELIIHELAEQRRFVVVERERLEALLREIKLSRSRYVDPKTAQKIGRGVGARFIVLGRYFSATGQLIVAAKLVEVETGVVVGGAKAAGQPSALLELTDNVSKQLIALLVRQRLEAPTKPAQPLKPWRPKQLPIKTAVLYSKALDSLDRGDKATAKKQLQEVLKAQPDFSLATLDLARLVK